MKARLFWIMLGLVCEFSVFAEPVILEWDPGTEQEGSSRYEESSAVASNYLFQVTTQAGDHGLWRAVLDVSAGEANLYVDNAASISTNSCDYKSTLVGSDAVVQSLSVGQTYYILVEAAAGAEWSLFAGDMHVTELTWDPGTADRGTEVYTNENSRVRAQYFKITTELPDLDAWRIALDCTAGENADLYIRQNALPYNNSIYHVFTDSSTRSGDDGFVRQLSYTSGSGQEWYILVESTEDATWKLLAGDVYAEDLGALSFTSGSDGNLEIPPEGIRYYKTTIPSEALAWRLWIQDDKGSGTLDWDFYVRHGLAPVPTSSSYYDRVRNGQALLVPNYVVPGSPTYYYVGIPGNPGADFRLYNRQHSWVGTPHGGTLAGQSDDSGFLYKTYRIDVPVDEIAWEIAVSPLNGTDPDFAVRREAVPNRFNNDAFSEVVSTSVVDSVTLVPETLSDGSFYVTVYGDEEFEFDLSNGEPEITQIDYASVTLNAVDVDRAGWRYFVVSDIEQQLGQLGWLLELENHVPGTEIAIRRNFVPGRWNYRQNGTTSTYEVTHNDLTCSYGFLQDPEHDADIWYVGVYMPNAALGAFTLHSGTHVPEEVAFDGHVGLDVVLRPKRWNFYHVTVPDQIADEEVLGWEFRLSEWAGSCPYVAIRRAMLPEELSSHSDTYSYWSSPGTYESWNEGWQWVKNRGDWISYSTVSEVRHSMALNNPIEPGSYYLGFFNNSTAEASYSFGTMAVGAGMSYEPTAIDFDGGSAPIVALPQHDVEYFKVTVPTNAASWRVQLEVTDGDAMLYLREGRIPTLGASVSDTYSPGAGTSYVKLEKSGDEHYVLMPESGAALIPGGDYYLMVASQGGGAGDSCSAVLHSLGEANVTPLGALPVVGAVNRNGEAYEAGVVKLYSFVVPDGVQSLEVKLENNSGGSCMELRTDTLFPSGSYYGYFSGNSRQYYSSDVITLTHPKSGMYSLLVYDIYNTPSAGNYDLSLTTSVSAEIDFDGGVLHDVEIPPHSWRYFHVNIPAAVDDNAVLGWEGRITEWSGNRPSLVARRDLLPENTGTRDWNYPYYSTMWASGYRWECSAMDWSGWYYDPDGQGYPQPLHSIAMGGPLEAGTYYLGFYNSSTDTTSTFSFRSSGIGAALTYDPADVAFDGGSVDFNDLEPRGVAYARVTIPENTSSWKVRLENRVGEAMLYIREALVPTRTMSSAQYLSPGVSFPSMTKVQKSGDEYFVLLPENDEEFIPAGDYYLMVVSEGQDPGSLNGSTIGEGNSSVTLHSLGEAPITEFGDALALAGVINSAEVYEAGEVDLFTFDVPAGLQALEVRLEDQVGNPYMWLRTDAHNPAAGNNYGLYSGESYEYQHDGIITISSPEEGTYSLTVLNAGAVSDGSYTLRITALDAIEVEFDGGGDAGVELAPQSWVYYKVQVPELCDGKNPTLGWELRINEWSGYRPQMVVRRDLPPESVSTSPYYIYNYDHWDSGWQWSALSLGWSAGRYYDAVVDGGQQYPQPMLSMAMGAPLEVGTYYIGFYNSSVSEESSFSFTSSGIGPNVTYDPQVIAFDGGQRVVSGLEPRDVEYFSVQVPGGQTSWELQLSNTVAECALYVRREWVPTLGLSSYPTCSPGASFSQMTKLQKLEDEHFVLLPENGAETIPAGLYYLLVVGEGDNPDSNRVGSEACDAVVISHGAAEISNLGALRPGNSVNFHNRFDSGAVNLYRFEREVATDPALSNLVHYLKIHLENVNSGDPENPELNLRLDGALPDGMRYGLYSGYSPDDYSQSILTVPNPETGACALVVGDEDYVSDLSACEYDLVIEDIIPPELIFDAAMITNYPDSNFASGVLKDDERDFYRVEVPEAIDGEPVLGWYLNTTVSQGEAMLRIRKDMLPFDSGADYYAQTYFTSSSLIAAPPYLTPGTWYVEVQGNGATTYTIASQAVRTEREWSMPGAGEGITTPGLVAPHFGDSGVDADGNDLPDDQGVDLENGYYHFYAVEVPEGNTGMLRTQLEAISGNPNLYIRQGAIPTLDHKATGGGSYDYIYEHKLVANANTEYGSWVPKDGRYETELAAGVWYIMVRADGSSNARYRLKLSGANVYAGGNVQALALNGGSFSDQLLAEGDMRHYRVEIPDPAPVGWTVSFAQTSGDVDLYIRDTLPAGNYGSSSSSYYIQDWADDAKNPGHDHPNFVDTGSYTLQMPALRPGHAYYLSFIAKSDASFSVGSEISGGIMPVIEKLNFTNDLVTVEIPANGSVSYQVDVPAAAVRWRHSHTNSANVNVFLQQGTFPYMGYYYNNHWYRTYGTSSCNKFLLNEDGWPWLPGYSYFITATNTSDVAESFTLVMDGSLEAEFPQNLSASDGSYADRVYLSWSSLSGVNDYTVWRNLVDDPDSAEPLDVAGSYYYYDYDALGGPLYYYWVSVAGVTNRSWFSASDSGWRSGVGVLSHESADFLPPGGTGTVDVVIDPGMHWNVVESQNWISIDEGSEGVGSGRVFYTVSPGAAESVATITIAGQPFTISRQALGVVDDLDASDGDYSDRVQLSWSPVEYADRYYVYYSSAPDGYKYGSGYAYTNQAASVRTANQLYYFWVRAYCGNYSSDYGNMDSGFRGASPEWVDINFPGGYPGDDEDSDGDGFSNHEEFIADTIPTNAASYLVIDRIEEVEGGASIFWTSAEGRLYNLYWKPEMTNEFEAIRVDIPYPLNSETDSVHQVESCGFYRISVELE